MADLRKNNWKGYLLKAVATNKIFPHEYMEIKTWNSTPNQREEIKAYRDDNTRNLTRITAPGKKSTFSFSTIPDLSLAEKIEIQNFFTDAESNSEERKVTLEYWNDEENDYKTGDFYRPNMQFTIDSITDTDITYEGLDFELIEY